MGLVELHLSECFLNLFFTDLISGYNCGTNNPCGSKDTDGLSFEHDHNPAMYIHCGFKGKICKVMSCPGGGNWTQEAQTCRDRTSGYNCDTNNPCGEDTDGLTFPHEYKTTKFIYCKKGSCKEINCPDRQKWSEEEQTCHDKKSQ